MADCDAAVMMEGGGKLGGSDVAEEVAHRRHGANSCEACNRDTRQPEFVLAFARTCSVHHPSSPLDTFVSI